MDVSLKLQEVFLEYLLDRDVLSEQDIIAALDWRREQTPPVGRIALKERVLTIKQVNKILMTQCDSGLPFGDQAVELGYLTPDQVQVLLQIQMELRPTPVEALQHLGILDTRRMMALREEFREGTLAMIT